MYEPRRDRTVKGQLLATAVLDFADYGIVKDGLMINIPMNCKRTFSNTFQPMLFLKIESFEKKTRVKSMERNRSEEFDEEAEIVSVTTDDDASSQSSTLTSVKDSKTESQNVQESQEVQNLEGFKNLKMGSQNAQESQEVQNLEGIKKVKMGSQIVQESQEVQNLEGVKKVKMGSQNVQESQEVQNLEGIKKVKMGSWRKDGLRDERKVQLLEQKVQNLENELREAAAIEVGLYSVVAEHGSSVNKVHAPARRLSRVYHHACKQNSGSRKSTCARSIVSGLILVAKACGNDVPRLTFWLSNCVVLRAIIHNSSEQLSKKSTFLKENRSGIHNEWENPSKLICALEKVESWIFSRIIESVWWQTLTPYMQSAAAKAIVRIIDTESSKKTLRGQQQSNFSMELWTTAFMDACERICPVRAGGHDCGCLPVISRLVMEQCMARLDVAMFNAILRESDDDVPTDPVSDPISDARVLPIASGKASFGAGAQLKNAIGNWSRWLTDLFGIDDDGEEDDNDASFKSFYLLNALSDLMMLPKDMLLSSIVRKEVCPIFGAPLIKKILDTFVPDEFCPDPIPEAVLEALESEDSLENEEEDCVMSLPCGASSVSYHPPSIKSVLGDGNQLTRSVSILRKSNTSDDELDELTSPLTSIIDTSSFRKSSTKSNLRSKDGGGIRYQLLKDVWMNE